MKQRREKVPQNAKDRKLAKANSLVALQASVRENRVSNDTQSITNTDDAVIGNDNTDAIIGNDNTDVIIGTGNTDNAAIDANNTDNAAIDADNTGNATTDEVKTDDAAMSDTNTDNTTTAEKKTDKAITGEASTVHVPLPPHSKEKVKDLNQIKPSSKHAIVTVTGNA